MNSFYCEGHGETGCELMLEAAEAHHASRVLRLKAGEEIICVDSNARRFRAELVQVGERETTARLLAELPDNEPPLKLTIYQGLPKADKLEWIAQKLTELGAAALVPVKMERVVVRLDEKDGKKRAERLARIAREAAKQCKRARPLEVAEPMGWGAAMARMQTHELILTPWEDARGTGMCDIVAQRLMLSDIGIVIGPEGGMSAAEVAALEEIGARSISLGPRILRTETAAVVACALAMHLWGDLS